MWNCNLPGAGVFFKHQRKLHLETQSAFVRVWQICFIGLVLDIASILILRYEELFSYNFAVLICNAYLLTILWKQVLGVLYIDAHISEQDDFKKKETALYLLYGMIGSILIMAAPIDGFMDRGKSGYMFGTASVIAYVLAIILLIRMILLLLQYRRQMTKNSKRGAVCWIGLCLAATIIQFFKNDLMIAGFFSAVGIMVIYLRLENPERFLDSDTGFFNKLAFKRYMRQIEETGKSVAILFVDYEQVGHKLAVMDREVRLEVYNFFDHLKKVYPFRGFEEGIILVFENEDNVLETIRNIQKRFEKPWGKYKDAYLKTRMVYLENIFMLKSPHDTKKIFNYVRHDKTMCEEGEFVVIDKNVIRDAYLEEDIEWMILDSIEKHRVEVFYQPIYSTKSKTFESAEALVRIRKEDGSLMMPGEFIEVAEKRGSILQVGEQVFEQVCRFIEEYGMDKLGLHYIEVNLSAVQCGYKNLAQEFIEIMKAHHVNPHFINLEITESASVGNEKVFLDNLYALREYGVSFSLDDFGTGQSNLNYIVAMPVDIVKFDRGMTQAYFESEKAKYVMDAARMMIQGMNLEIVSEGIENEEQLEIMTKLGIQYVQGYYFSKPLAKEKFVDFIKKRMYNKAYQ